MFEGVVGDNFLGDIALDDITLYDGACPQEGNGHQSNTVYICIYLPL